MATNHTLQRSLYSFRRQGSSGRICDDNYFTKSCELRTPRKVQESNNYVTKSCELPVPRKVRQSRFSCELNKMQCQPSMSLQRQPSATFHCNVNHLCRCSANLLFHCRLPLQGNKEFRRRGQEGVNALHFSRNASASLPHAWFQIL